MIRNIAVYCASADGFDPLYRTAATELGTALAEYNIGVVYGGARVGLMRAVADAALRGGGRVVGVIPEVLMSAEVAHQGLSELRLVDTMHTRKALMAELADAFVVLPGGYGTLEELFEAVTWQTLKLHAKPVVLVNIGGFYDELLRFLDRAVEAGMLKRRNRDILLVAGTVAQSLHLLGVGQPA